MHTLLIVVGVNAATFGFAFLLGGGSPWLLQARLRQMMSAAAMTLLDRRAGFRLSCLSYRSVMRAPIQCGSPIIGRRVHKLAT